MQRSKLLRSSGPAGGWPQSAYRSFTRRIAPSVIFGRRPFGGSTISEVRIVPDTFSPRSSQKEL